MIFSRVDIWLSLILWLGGLLTGHFIGRKKKPFLIPVSALTILTMAIEIPILEPVIFAIGPLVVRWYALAYLAGFLIGWKYCLWLVSRHDGSTSRPNRDDIDDFLLWAVVGVILGGRLGYVLFYQPSLYISQPLEIFQIWHGGMSFHGGLLGVMAAIIAFSMRKGIAVLRLSDLVCAAAPIGLFFGRIANFINGELMGRPTTLPWGVIFPDGTSTIRHPSQIYEALLEGLLLFVILFFLANHKKIRKTPGVVTGAFLIGYGIFRALVEFVRMPDIQIGLIGGMISMGQILCLPMIIGGFILVVLSRRAYARPVANN